MIDVLGESLRAVGTRSALAYPLVVTAGLITGIGPCAAPRYVAMTALVNGTPRPWKTIAAFVTGLISAYLALGTATATIGTATGATGAGASATGMLWSASSVVYAVLAVALLIGGIATLLRAGAWSGAGTCTDHSHDRISRGTASTGGAFLLGASGVLVVSPCCTPIVAGIAGLTIATGRAADGVALLAAFAGGHAMPVVVAGVLGDRFAAGLRRLAISQAPAIVSGSLMLALAVYYGTLA